MLSRLALLHGPSTKPGFAQGVGPWLGWADAIAMAAALQARAAAAPRRPDGAAAAQREFERVRETLLQRIADDGQGARQRAAAPDDGAEPQRQRYAALQQAMQSAIQPLRAQARAAVAQGSADLQRLAALDAVLEPVLAAREHELLALMPTLLAQHHERLRDASPGGSPPWQQTFARDMQALLRAELELRLQPVRGLIDTLRSAARDDDE
jgi:hypothetical protein